MTKLLFTYSLLTIILNVQDVKRVDIVQYQDVDGLYTGFKIDWVYFLMTEKDIDKLLTSDEEVNMTVYIQCDPADLRLMREGTIYTAQYISNRVVIKRKNKVVVSIFCDQKEFYK
jgi:hypothetical protein